MLAKKIDRSLPLVVVVGRTNVGKSTLFNSLTDKNKKRALVSKIAGTTRDVNMGQVEWQRSEFMLVDTGGFMDTTFLANKNAEAVTIDEVVQRQAREFITRADLVLFMVDNKDGLMADDRRMAEALKRILPNTKHVILVTNKVDAIRERGDASQFYKLDLGEPQIISAATGSGTGDLLDVIVDRLEGWEPRPDSIPLVASEEGERSIKVCLIGKPNVGKSSLLNAILGYERVIVSPIAHTTREPQDTDIVYKDVKIKIVDTAGIHRQGMKIGNAKARDMLTKRLEHQGIAATLRTLGSADIVLFVVDINEELTKQDVKLVEEILERRKSLIMVANKWDLVEERDTKKYSQMLYGHIPFAQFAPIQFVSAKTNEKVHKILDEVLEIDKNRHLEIPEEDLNEFIARAISRHLPTRGGGQRYPRIRSFKQSGTNPPEFAVKVGSKEYLADSYLHYLSNRLRERYELTGTPIKLWVEKTTSVHGKRDD